MTRPKVTAVKYMLWSQDMDRALRFWSGTFGFAKTLGDEHWTELDVGGAVVALHGGHDGSRNITGLSLTVDDIEVATQAVAEAGGQIVNPPRSRPGEPIILADVVDTEGNQFMLVQPAG